MNIDNAIDYGTGASAGVLVYLTAILGTPEASSFAAAVVVFLASVATRLAFAWAPGARRWLRQRGLDRTDDGAGLEVVDVDRLISHLSDRTAVPELVISEALGNWFDGSVVEPGDITEALQLLAAVREPGELRDLLANYHGVNPDHDISVVL